MPSEYWIYGTGYGSGGSSPVGQLGARPGTVCDSLSLNYGSQPNWGSISFYSCDYPWIATSDSPADTVSVPGSGVMPVQFKWNHVAYTYTGNTGSPAYQLNMYLNGVIYRATSVQLNIRRTQVSVPRRYY